MTRGFDKMTDAEAAAWNELTPREMTFVSPEAVKAVLRAQAAAASRAQYVAELEKRLSEPASAERKYTQADMERYGKCYADARDKRLAASASAEPVYYRYRHSEGEKWHYGPTPQNWWECQPLGVIASPAIDAAPENSQATSYEDHRAEMERLTRESKEMTCLDKWAREKADNSQPVITDTAGARNNAKFALEKLDKAHEILGDKWFGALDDAHSYLEIAISKLADTAGANPITDDVLCRMMKNESRGDTVYRCGYNQALENVRKLLTASPAIDAAPDNSQAVALSERERDLALLAAYAEGSKSPEIANASRRVRAALPAPTTPSAENRPAQDDVVETLSGLQRYEESSGEGGGVYENENGDFIRLSDAIAAIASQSAKEPR
jgi:hypothetical protein